MWTARRAPLAGALLAALLVAGCAQITAGRLTQAPNTFPEIFTPRARVRVDYGGFDLRQFPHHTLTVGPERAVLGYRVVEPAAYQLRMDYAWETNREPARMNVTFRAVPPGVAVSGDTQPRGTVVLLHGYGMEQSSLLPWALRLAAEGWRCVLVDLRGHGRSTGRRIYFGTLETFDLMQLLDALERAGQGIQPVAVLGESYGAAIALRWAARDARVARVVALAPYPELRPAALNLRAEFASWFPRRWVSGALDRLPRMLAVKPPSLDPLAVVAGQPVRALLVAGGADRIAPPEEVARLAHGLAGRGEFLLVPGVVHEGLGLRLDLLGEPVIAWLAAAAENPAPAAGSPAGRP